MRASPNGRGRGRPKGALNKRSQAVLSRVEETGLTPLDVIIAVMRHHWSKALKAENEADKEVALGAAAGFAKDAAPYLHPRLQTTALTGKDGKDLIPLDAIRAILKEDGDA